MQEEALTSPHTATSESVTEDDAGTSISHKLLSHGFVDMDAEFDVTDSPNITMEYPASLLFSDSAFGSHSGSISCQSVDLSIDPLAQPAGGGDPVLDIFSPVPFSGTTLRNPSPGYPTDTTNAAFTDDASTASQTLDILASNTSDSKCSCDYEAVSIYEAIEVNLVWDPRNGSGTTDEILQHQKKALARCEALFECRPCSARSGYIMLVIAMCGKMLGSLENMELGILLGLGEGSEPGPELTTALKVVSPLQVSSQLEKESTLRSGVKRSKRGFTKEQLGRASSGSSSSSIDENRWRRLKIGRWQLDDDDELHVLQSLLTARMTRLGSLIGMIEGVVDGNCWPAHEGMTRDLRERFTQAMFTIKKMLRTK